MFVLLLLLLLLIIEYLFVLSMLILVIVGFTYPPTMHFKFITKRGKCYYKLRQLVYYEVRQVVLQCATILLLQKYD